jgi:iron only hydrogenase large subunit-like protein
MSCPGGCLNGGGQLKPKEKNIKPREMIPKLIEIMSKGMQEYEDKKRKEIIERLETIGKGWLDAKAVFKHVGSDDLINP